MKLLKFGGTSLANAEKFLCVADIIEKNQNNEQVATVLSAPAKITNYLVNIIENDININKILEQIDLAEKIFIEIIRNIKKIQSYFLYEETKQIIKIEFNKLKKIVHDFKSFKKYPENIQAIIISRGEILSIWIMKNILISRNHQITIIDPVENIVSIGNFLNSAVDINESKKRISKININKNNIILMAGFIAGNKKNELVILGRNGSDYSAAILACCLNANLCEIWTDVDGVLTSDPKKISNTSLLKSISYEEAMELSYFGAKVLHPKTIEPLKNFNIPCIIKNTSNIQSQGTLICKNNDCNQNNILKGVTNLDNIVMFTMSGCLLKQKNDVLPRIFNLFEKENINIILITQSSSKNNFSFCTLEKDSQKILFILNKLFKSELKEKLLNSIHIISNLSILSIIGFNISQKYDIASKIFCALGKSKVNVLAISQGSSKHSISVVIKKENVLKSLQNIHNTLFYNKKIINVFLLGIGGVGRTLIKQILKQKNFLENKNIEIKIRTISNSKKILFLNDLIDLKNWEKHFQESKKQFNLEILNKLLKENSFLNSVVIDCTSDEILSQQYINFFSKGFHVITSNKKANTSSLKYYNDIRNTTLKENKKFLYETNVGAGLPIIQTLQNLVNTGDNLICFKGILSGSLSFIFGKLEENILLSDATKKAKDLGFTEPNPCDDLSGIDVARKLLILAREVGYKIELEDIEIEPILPKNFQKCKNTKEFLNKLKEIDISFVERVRKARNIGKVLRFVGTIEKGGKCSVKIEEINSDNPLYKVKNGENALTFYTNYYQPIPLVLRGYGAGNDVTASGVFSDLLRIIL
ncbi:bifunctional aspartate kinase/homoserine dehydrogenase I [Buchnera aphidicola (Aphis helianthi)]|uniref:Bifunctional aspartokinase/homoserine dehydrogenase n=1 Tax=Buchnera aphidicola (Aphis helianthi) TaxID=2315802 RepID=A0A4D6XIY9_9GAMM|nr:bifunctional aspartate kinase/homoserine dehydrogenase I [Buchnera aphidicola]QCI17026.1 bifunctional aspartate kinase/homoserine dehydrogenase I [Buchnera aphidicola (Aphis helianthi)]